MELSRRWPCRPKAHQGPLPAQHAFLQVSQKHDNVVVTALKKSEDDNSLVVRFYEWAGKDSDVTIQLPPGAESASETDLMERPLQSLPLQSNAVTVHTKPYEIKIIKAQFAPPAQAQAAAP